MLRAIAALPESPRRPVFTGIAATRRRHRGNQESNWPIYERRLDFLVERLIAWAGTPELADHLRSACRGNVRVLGQRPETLTQNAVESASAMGMTPASYLRACCARPDLLYRSPLAMGAWMTSIGQLLGISTNRLAKSVARQSAVLSLSPENLKLKLAGASRKLGISETHYARLCARVPALLTRTPQRIEANASGLARALDIDLLTVSRMVTRRPQLLLNSAHHAATTLAALCLALHLPTKAVSNLLVRNPALLSQRVETIDANVSRLAELLKVEREEIIRAATVCPTLLQLNPDRIAAKVMEAARLLRVSPELVTNAILRMPSLTGREVSAMTRRIRLVARIAGVLGQECSHADVLMQAPAAATYNMDRLLLRYLHAKLGIRTGKWTSLVARSDAKVRADFARFLDSLPASAAEVCRLQTILARRLPNTIAT